MSGIYVGGLGAVSPAGWTVPELRAALDGNVPLPTTTLAGAGNNKPLQTRLVPPPVARPGFLTHPRLRRASPITHYAAAAALEALSPLRTRLPPNAHTGLICCFQSGCVQYSCRFFEEMLKDPGTASPLAFPETVFAAPTSHIAALLDNVSLASSIIGDPATFLQGLAAGADWLTRGKVDICLVVGAEESHWLLADALSHFQHSAVFTSGAGAVCLTADPGLSAGVQLEAITDAHTFTAAVSRRQAALQMRSDLPAGSEHELLVDGLDSSPNTDAAETLAWQTWPGVRLSPKRILGEGLMASAAWQCVAACDVVAAGRTPAANVSLVGCNQQAVGARFVAHCR
jgi:3-Oxoacyl-[acyl-carrier-protein (ACP)] synthase III